MPVIRPERLSEIDQAAAAANVAQEVEGDIREFVRRDVSVFRRTRAEGGGEMAVENINSLIQREFTDQQRATMGSLNSFVGSIVLAGFSLLLGAMADRLGVIPALVIASLLSLIPMSMYWRTLRPERIVTPPPIEISLVEK